MITLVTMLGLQPGAVASDVLTLNKKFPINSLVILHTQKTLHGAQRLKTFFNKELPDLELETKSFNANPAMNETIENNSSPWEIISNLLENAGENDKIYLDISPGLNFHIALLARNLPDDKRLVPLYSDHSHLYALSGESWSQEKESIGLKNLLELHGLKLKRSNEYTDGFYKDVMITKGAENLELARAAERYGHLYGLYLIWSKGEGDNEKHRIKQDARKVEALARSGVLLNHLRPFIAVLTNDEVIRRRLRSYGIEDLFLKQNSESSFTMEAILSAAAKTWEEGSVGSPPKLQSPSQQENRLTIDKSKNFKIRGNRQWNGNSLVVCLGSDPSATLVSIVTHKPARLCVLVDVRSDWNMTIAQRLADRIPQLGVAEAIFWPTDMLGNIYMEEEFSQLLAQNEWVADISPGTKAQTWVLSRRKNLAIWSIVRGKRQAEPLESKTSKDSPKPLGDVGISLQASVVGGPLKTLGRNFATLKMQKEFLISIARIISLAARNNISLMLKGGWRERSIIKIDNRNYIRCVRVNQGQIELEVKENGNISTGWLSSAAESGAWIEEAIAAAFMQAGGDLIKDLTVGLKWMWPGSSRIKDSFKTELDIGLLWGAYFIGISCKVGGSNIPLSKVRTEVIAETRAGLGRLALPVLVRGAIKAKEAESDAIERLENGFEPLEIGLSILDQPDTIKKLIQLAIKKKSTVPWSYEKPTEEKSKGAMSRGEEPELFPASDIAMDVFGVSKEKVDAIRERLRRERLAEEREAKKETPELNPVSDIAEEVFGVSREKVDAVEARLRLKIKEKEKNKKLH